MLGVEGLDLGDSGSFHDLQCKTVCKTNTYTFKSLRVLSQPLNFPLQQPLSAPNVYLHS